MKKRFTTIAALGLAAMVSLTGCMNSTVQKNAEESNKSEEAGQENSQGSSGSEGEGTYTDIILWDGMTDGDGNVLMQELADGFAAEHGIKVERVVMKMEDLRTTIKAAINSGEGPDVFSYEIGAGYLGVLAKSGLAYDLTDYAKDNGWYDLFMDNALSSCTFDEKLYGVGNELEALGVFYNKSTFEKYDLKEPETYEEFEEICKTLKEKGETPIMVDDLDQWPGYHYESLWTNAFAGCDTMNDILALKAEFNQESTAEGLDHLYEIVTNGWTIDSPNAMAHDDARKMFMSGKVAMYPTGTWEVSTFGSKEEGLDGCNEFTTFLYIMAPLIKPALSALLVFEFMWSWNDMFLPMLVVYNDTSRTLPLGLMFFFGKYTADHSLIAAGVTICTLPIVIVYTLFQKNFIEGVTAGAVKG